MFVNKDFIYRGRAYLKKYKVLYCEIFSMLFLCEDKDIDRFP